MSKVEIPAGTVPPASKIPNSEHRVWKPIGFRPVGHPPWAVPAGCSALIRCGDLLGPDSDPFREFHRVEFIAAEPPR